MPTNPRVMAGSDGRIAYLFGVMSHPQADPYFVVYVLRSTGQQDASAVAAGRLSVVIPASAGLNFDTLRLLSGPCEIVVMGMTTTQIAANAGT